MRRNAMVVRHERNIQCNAPSNAPTYTKQAMWGIAKVKPMKHQVETGHLLKQQFEK